MEDIMRHYWPSWAKKFRKKAPIWQKESALSSIVAAPTVFTGFGPQWLLPVSKHEKIACRKVIWVKRGRDHQNRGLFWRTSEMEVFRQLEKIIKWLGQVYRATRRLCWKIKVMHRAGWMTKTLYILKIIHLWKLYSLSFSELNSC